MDVKKFYGKSKTRKVTTLREAYEDIIEGTVETISILPPESGDQGIPSDEEDIDSGDMFEPAGELELGMTVESDSSDEEEDILVVPKKKQKQNNKKEKENKKKNDIEWKKNNRFDKKI